MQKIIKLKGKQKEKTMEEIIYSVLIGFHIWVLILVIAVCLAVLSKGADILVNEAVSLSIHWGISKMIIGATIVSLGTTLPEAAVSVLAAVKGNADLALGNAIGSIIVDTGLIIGVSAWIGTLFIDKELINNQGRIQLAAGILLFISCLPYYNGTGIITQWIGFLFILLLAGYIYMTIQWGKKSKNQSPVLLTEDRTSLFAQFLKLALGIIMVIISSQILIPSVEITALRIGIPQSVIAATLVAFGTSLPELVTAITAVRKGHGEIAIGNVIGADILNVLFVVGSSAAVTKGGLIVPEDFYKLQLPFMLVLLLIFRIIAKGKKGFIAKKEGALLVGMYLIYLILNYFN